MIRRPILFMLILIFAGAFLISGCSNNQQAQNPLSVKIISPSAGEAAGSSINYQAEVANAQGELKQITWDFGDGQTGSALQGTHQYTSGGDFRVQVSITDSQNRTAKDEVAIKIAQGPSAVATVRRAANASEAGTLFLSDEAPLHVQFSSQASKPGPTGTLASYHWDFGNGDESSEQNPIHTYNEIGEYPVTLTVTDQTGKSSLANVTVRVIAYEPVKATLSLIDGNVGYELYSKNARNLNTGPSLFLQYVVQPDRKLSEADIKAVLDDIVTKARQRPRVSRISVQLFDKIKNEFMVPREYAHYLGAIIWDRLEEETSFTVNQRYLDGSAVEVLSIGLMENMLTPDDSDCGDLCANFKIGLVDIFLEEDETCRDSVDRTFREIVSWRVGATFDGFLVTIHPWDLGDPVAWAIGTKANGPALNQLPVKFFSNPPSNWNDKTDPNLWISYTSLPACNP